MSLPDPHANEPTVELDPDKVRLLREAKDAIEKWTAHHDRLQAELIAALGPATAGTVNGVKVIYYRPKKQWAIKSLMDDYSDLTQHFMRTQVKEVFDANAFGVAHPEILDKYRVRQFVERSPLPPPPML